MCSILHRYVYRQLVRSFALAFFALMIVMLLGGIYRPLKMGLGLGQLIQFLPYILPYALPWVIPASLLTACLMTYGRLAADNELQAVAASGLPVRYMCYPAFILALAVAAGSLPINTRLIPYCRAMQKQVIAAALTERPFAISLLGGQDTIEIGEFRLFVVSIDGDLLRKVLVIAPMQEEQPAPPVPDSKAPAPASAKAAPPPVRRMQVYRADEARYAVDPEKHVLRIEFRDARYTIVTPNESASGWLALTADEQTIAIPFGGTADYIRSARSELYSDELVQEARGCIELLATDLPKRDILRLSKKLAAVLSEVHRREALALSAFVLCLVGVPLGICIRRESKLASFAVAVLVFLLLYALLVGGESLAMAQRLPPRLALWGPDALMGLLGLGLLVHTFRR